MVQALRLACEVVAEVWMGDADERGGPFADAATEELGDAVLGHDCSDMGTARDDARTLGEHGNDARDRSAGGNGG